MLKIEDAPGGKGISSVETPGATEKGLHTPKPPSTGFG
jgi:hypothetical protein